MRKQLLILISISALAMLPNVPVLFASAASVYDITEYAAVGDGETNNTDAIQSAVDACSDAGGGTVEIPPGTFVSGTIYLKNGVELHLSHGATLLGSPNLDDYPVTEPELRSYTDNYVCRSLIYAEKQENIAITGLGTIDGNGHGPEFQEEGYTQRTRPYIIRMIECKNIRIHDVFLTRSPMWMQHYLGCENMSVRGVRVWNHGNRNNDAIDLDGCRNVTLSDCIFDSDDDALTFKSTSPYISENITVTNCVLSSHCNACKMGTESTGGFRNITISNITIKPSDHEAVVYGRAGGGISGIALEMVDGGVLEYIAISNVTIIEVGTPIFIRLGKRHRKHTESAPEPDAGVLRHVKISNVIAYGTLGAVSSISGYPGNYVEDVTLDNIRITSRGGIDAFETPYNIPENAEGYPEALMFGEKLPAYGLFARHVKGLTIRNAAFCYEEDDGRPAVICDDVHDIHIDRLEAQPPASGQPVLDFLQCTDGFITACKPSANTPLFLRVSGAESADVTLTGNDFSAVTETTKESGGASGVINNLDSR